MEDSYTRYEVLSDATAGQSTRTIKINLNPNKFLGISKPMAASQVRGSAGSNPTEAVYFHAWTAAVAKIVIPIAVQCTISFAFTAILTEPKTPGQS